MVLHGHLNATLQNMYMFTDTQPHKSLVINVLAFTFREIAIVLRIVHGAASHLLLQILVVMRRS